MIDPMYPIYICLGILALWFFAEKLPEIRRMREAGKKFRHLTVVSETR